MSVVVPVRDRRDLLRSCLDGLAAQTLVDHEIIVVDDGSVDGSGKEGDADAAAGRPVRVVRTEGCGAVGARAAGVAVAQGRYLAFTDSDCVPTPEWLASGIAALDAGADVVQGLTRPNRATKPLERSIWVLRESGLYETCNVFYRREAFDAAGGFDTTAGAGLGFRPGRTARHLGMGEDTLLGWRVRRAGHSAWAPQAVVEHAVFAPDVRDKLRRTWMMGAFPALVREVPELRDLLLTRRYFAGHPLRLPLYGAVVLVLTGHPRVAIIPAAGWVALRARRLHRDEPSRRQVVRLLPADLATEAVAAAALAVGSVRARRIVL